jgi:hypothetical protein
MANFYPSRQFVFCQIFTSAAVLSLIIGLVHRLTTCSAKGLKLLTTCKTNNKGHIHFLAALICCQKSICIFDIFLLFQKGSRYDTKCNTPASFS